MDHALCKLPFEQQWFRDRGCEATYVGHPYFDELRAQQLCAKFQLTERGKGGRVVTLLPGSRTQEVKNNLPQLIKSAEEVHSTIRDARFLIASYNDRQADLARQMLAGKKLPAEVHVGKTAECIALAESCMACSGSVSLELLYHAKPSVMVYKVPWLTFQIANRVVQVPYMTLANLIATGKLDRKGIGPYSPHDSAHDGVLFPEYPSWQDQSKNVAAHVIEWLLNEPLRQKQIARLSALRDTLALGGASKTAAAYVRGILPNENKAAAAYSKSA